MIQKLKFVQGFIENIVGKGGKSGYQHFLLFPPCFPQGLCLRVIKKLCGKGLNEVPIRFIF